MRRDFQTAEISAIRKDLLTWYDRYRRDLPWRRTRDPYAIWLSETMLQQTRVAAVIPYYERFLQLFPTVYDLAAASEDALLAAWAGLGYYYRARNLQKAAQIIHDEGTFPATYDQIRALPGVGDYTAAAIASIAFDLPHAVVDGNVLRVLSRMHGDSSDIATTAGRQHFSKLAQELLDEDNPSSFNQAVMELGATVCLPKNPQCLLCPLSRHCRARQQGKQLDYPVKSIKAKSTDEERTIYWIERDGSVLACQRPAHAKLMPGFWELPEPSDLPGFLPSRTLGSFRHGITTHNYRFTLHAGVPPNEVGNCSWLYLEEVRARPISTVFRKALQLVKKHPKQLAATVN
jgi:A/G-specific adenine glycosylase